MPRPHVSGSFLADMKRFLGFLWSRKGQGKGKGRIGKFLGKIADHARREGGLR